MRVTFDNKKRLITIEERGLDFIDASLLFENEVYEFEDIRNNYGEKRMIAVGYLQNRMIIIGYVERGETRHIFSMRKANEREIKKYQERFEES